MGDRSSSASTSRPGLRRTGTCTGDPPKILPSGLRTREGWADFFERQRPEEPHLHQIEPTNHCPYACVMCPRSEKMTRPLGFMAMDLFRKVIDEVAAFSGPSRGREIELFHFGESLLHPQIDAMVAYASGVGLNVVLSVNAPDLTADLARRLLAARPARLIVSLDGVDAETYRRLRGPRADFESALRNLHYLARWRRESASEIPVVVRMIELEANGDQVEAFTRRWAAEGLEPEIRGFFPWGEKGMVGLGRFQKYPPNMPCPFPWQHLVVQWNGDVVPCCRDYNARLVFGNVGRTTLREIWGGEPYRRFREQHRTGAFGDNRTCRECTEVYFTPGDSDGAPLDLQAQEVLYWMGHLQESSAVAARLGRPEESVASTVDALCARGFLARDPAGAGWSPTSPHFIPRPSETEDDLATVWRCAVERNRERPFLLEDADGSRFTYGDAGSIVEALAHRLRAPGLGPGSRVLVWAALHPESIFLFWACALVGALYIPLDPDLPEGRAREMARQMAPDLVVADAARIGGLEGLAPAIVLDGEGVPPPGVPELSAWIREEDRRPFPAPPPARQAPLPAAVIFTSGSEGRPKAVVLRQSALAHSGRLVARAYGWGPGDLLLSTGELHAVSGLRNPALAVVHAGAAAVLVPPEVRHSPLAAAALIQRLGVTVLATVPAALRHLLAAAPRLGPDGLRPLRMVLVAGSRLPKELREAFLRTFSVPVYNYYGLTETAGFCAGDLPGDPPALPDTIGREVDALVRVVGEGGEEVAAGEIGELWVQSANCMIEYAGDPAGTESAYAGRWFKTGDRVRRNPDGSLALLGRRTELLKNAHGELVSAVRVEEALRGDPQLADACVRSALSDSGLEIFRAFVAPRAPVAPQARTAFTHALRSRLADALGPKEVPEELVLVERIPRTAGGKVLFEGLVRARGDR